MARARNIKPGFFINDELVELPFEVRLLFIGLWTIADREGRLLDRPKKIKMEIFPADSVDCEIALGRLADSGFIQRYQSDGVSYLQIVNWHRHQNPHVKEASSAIPAPDGQHADLEQASYKHSASTVQASELPERAGLIPDSLNLIPDSLIRIPDTGFPQPASADAAMAERGGFARFWLAYPKKVGKGDAEKAYKRIAPGVALLDTILAAVEAAKGGADWLKNSGQYIPNPATWLNGKRWEDEVKPYTPEQPRASPSASRLGTAGQATAIAAQKWLEESNAI